MFVFTEIQKVRQWWIWAAVSAPFVVMLIVFMMVPDQEHELPVIFWPVFLLVPLTGFFLILALRLETRIDNEKLTFRFFPFHLKPREVYWSEIESACVRDYKPVKEYGGWGLKQSRAYGKAFTISGNKGLQLVMKNGEKILIGTSRPEELHVLMLQLKKTPGTSTH